MRTTIGRSFSLRGVGLHTGAHVGVTLEPAKTGHGITFCRVDLPGRPIVPAILDAVVSSE